MASYPNVYTNVIDDLTEIVAGHINKLEAKVGITGDTPAGNPLGISSLDYRVANLETSVSTLETNVSTLLGDVSTLQTQISPLLPLVDNAALLPGRAGGQVLKGGTEAGENLTLISTSHTTKGKLLFGNSSDSYFEEALQNLKIAGHIAVGNNAPLSNSILIYADEIGAGQYLYGINTNIRSTYASADGSVIGVTGTVTHDNTTSAGILRAGYFGAWANNQSSPQKTITELGGLNISSGITGDYNTATLLYGIDCQVYAGVFNMNSCDITEVSAGHFTLFLGTGDIDIPSAKTLFVEGIYNGVITGSLGTLYGVYINDHSLLGFTTCYNLYSAGVGSRNHLQGNLELGNAATVIGPFANIARLYGADYAVGDTRLYIQSELGNPIIIGNNEIIMSGSHAVYAADRIENYNLGAPGDTNYERSFTKWDSDMFIIGNEAGGTGKVRDLAFSAARYGFGNLAFLSPTETLCFTLNQRDLNPVTSAFILPSRFIYHFDWTSDTDNLLSDITLQKLQVVPSIASPGRTLTINNLGGLLVDVSSIQTSGLLHILIMSGMKVTLSNSTGATVDTAYGLYISDTSLVATDPYNIYSAGPTTKNYFEGKAIIGPRNPPGVPHPPAPVTFLAVGALPAFPNNAAALAGGLTAGDFYIPFPAIPGPFDPMPVCVVV